MDGLDEEKGEDMMLDYVQKLVCDDGVPHTDRWYIQECYEKVSTSDQNEGKYKSLLKEPVKIQATKTLFPDYIPIDERVAEPVKCTCDHNDYTNKSCYEDVNFDGYMKKGGKLTGAVCRDCALPMMAKEDASKAATCVVATSAAPVYACKGIMQQGIMACLKVGIVCNKCYTKKLSNLGRPSRRGPAGK